MLNIGLVWSSYELCCNEVPKSLETSLIALAWLCGGEQSFFFLKRKKRERKRKERKKRERKKKKKKEKKKEREREKKKERIKFES